MTEKLQNLQRDYREIKAPPHLATRIHAEVADRPRRASAWMPATATLLVLVGVVWLIPLDPPQQGSDATKSTPGPSLTKIAALKPNKPVGVSTSLSSVRSVKVPVMPSKPQLTPEKPKSNINTEHELMEEIHHAHS